MSKDLTEAEVMGRAPPDQVFLAHGPDGDADSFTFGTIGAWQAFMDQAIQTLTADPARLRIFFDRNENILNDLGQQPAFAKAVEVIRAQFAKALGEQI